MNVLVEQTVRRGEFVTHCVHDLSRVGHPKTADVVELGDGYLVVPVSDVNPIMKRDTLAEAMSYITRYINDEKGTRG